MTLENLIDILREERRCLDDAVAAVGRLTTAIGIRIEATRAYESACSDLAERASVLEVVQSLHAEEWVAELVH